MKRREFRRNDITLSALDTGGEGPLVLCLHALWMQAGSFQSLAERLFPAWRVVALDLRGHGQSSRADDYARDAFHDDIVAVLETLDAGPAAVIGNSLGGSYGIQLAARRPDLVRALVNEEGSIEENLDLSFVDHWRGSFADRTAFAKTAGPLYWSLASSLVEEDGGTVRLGVEVDDLNKILAALKGGFRSDWLAVTCPTLVVRGIDSKAVAQSSMEKMAQMRPGTELAVIEGGHVTHEDNLQGFLKAVRPFLDRTAS